VILNKYLTQWRNHGQIQKRKSKEMILLPMIIKVNDIKDQRKKAKRDKKKQSVWITQSARLCPLQLSKSMKHGEIERKLQCFAAEKWAWVSFSLLDFLFFLFIIFFWDITWSSLDFWSQWHFIFILLFSVFSWFQPRQAPMVPSTSSKALA